MTLPEESNHQQAVTRYQRPAKNQTQYERDLQVSQQAVYNSAPLDFLDPMHQHAQQIYDDDIAQIPVLDHQQAVIPYQYPDESQMQYGQDPQALQQVYNAGVPQNSVFHLRPSATPWYPSQSQMQYDDDPEALLQICDARVSQAQVHTYQHTAMPSWYPYQTRIQYEQDPEALQQVYNASVPPTPVFHLQPAAMLYQYPYQTQMQYEQDPEALWQDADSATPPTSLSQPRSSASVDVDNRLRAENCFAKFNEYFGGDAFDLEGLQKLCEVAGIVPPKTVKRCHKALSKVHMNIFDVVEIGGRYETVVPKFPNKNALFEYSRDEGKLWPKGLDKSPMHLMVQLMWNFDGGKRRVTV